MNTTCYYYNLKFIITVRSQLMTEDFETGSPYNIQMVQMVQMVEDGIEEAFA